MTLAVKVALNPNRTKNQQTQTTRLIHQAYRVGFILQLTLGCELADDNFRFDENGRKFSKWVGNTVGKGETSNFSFFHSVLERLVLQTRKKKGFFGKGVKDPEKRDTGKRMDKK